MLKAKLDATVRIGNDTLYPVPAELIALLRAVRSTGSLMLATKEAGVSYRHAWGLLRRWETITGHELAVLTRGKGTGLTPFGARLAGLAEWLEPKMLEQFAELSDALAAYLAVEPTDAPPRASVHASHDVALLKLKERLDGHRVLDLRFEGSLNSLDSLGRGACEIAGFHLPEPPQLLGPLLDEFTARLKGHDMHVARLFQRHQGFMLPATLRRRVRGVVDLARHGLVFVNRERGSGTRLLFDALLQRAGLAPADIAGYDHEEFTHMATAATVRAGMAQAAFGIEAAARAHGLRFVRVVTEHYYLACRRNSTARIAVDDMIAAVRSPAFAKELARIGGYDASRTTARVAIAEVLGRKSAD